MFIGAGAGAGVLLGRAELMDRLAQAEGRRAQLSNVRLRQEQVAAICGFVREMRAATAAIGLCERRLC